MKQPEQEPRLLAISYEKVAGKPTFTATGALGGPSPDSNSVIAQLYVEHPSIPTIVSHPVMEDDTIDLSPEHARAVSRGDVTREVQATLVLSPEAAISLGEWLAGHGKTALRTRNARQSGGNP